MTIKDSLSDTLMVFGSGVQWLMSYSIVKANRRIHETREPCQWTVFCFLSCQQPALFSALSFTPGTPIHSSCEVPPAPLPDLASFPGFLTVQFLIACSIGFCILQVIKNWTVGRAWNKAISDFHSNNAVFPNLGLTCPNKKIYSWLSQI